MSAGRYDGFVIEQGATFSELLRWLDDDDNPVDLTDYTAKMQLRSAKDSDTIIIELNTENGRITLGGALGTIALLISDDDTALLLFDRAVWDLELTSLTGVVIRLMEGFITFSKEVTR